MHEAGENVLLPTRWGTTMHWHGMWQNGTNEMDGVDAVTQCSFPPGTTFTYRFVAYPAGTHWYHSHDGVQYADGLSGPLIVMPKTPTNVATEEILVFLSQCRGVVIGHEKCELFDIANSLGIDF